MVINHLLTGVILQAFPKDQPDFSVFNMQRILPFPNGPPPGDPIPVGAPPANGGELEGVCVGFGCIELDLNLD